MITKRSIGLALCVVAYAASVWSQTRINGAAAQSTTSNDTTNAVTPDPAKESRHQLHKATKAFLAGARAIERADARTAEKDFELAHELDPENPRYPLSANIARQFIVAQLVQRAEKKWSLGQKDDALAALEDSMRFDPENPMVAACLASFAGDSSSEMPSFRADRGIMSEPIALAPQDGQHSFHLHADGRDMISQVLNTFEIRATIDQSMSNRVVHFDVDEVDFADAADLLQLATGTFFIPLDPKSVIVVADTSENRAKFERRAMRTFYFPGLNSRELADMGNIARNVVGMEQSTLEADKSMLTVRGPVSELEALNEIYAEILEGRGEVQLEVRLYEIDKTKATNVGMILPASTTLFNVPSEINSILKNNTSLIDQLLSEYPSLAGNYEAILAALIASGALTGTVFNSPFAVFGGGLTKTGLDLSGVSINMLLNSSDARSFNQLELRVLDQEEATVRSGERYPIMTSSYSSLGASSSSNGTIPQIQYEDLGLTFKVNSHVESRDEVSLNLDMKISSLAGAGLNNIPILTNRQYTGRVSVHLGDTTVLLSDLSRQESLEITGVPGLSDFPGLSGTTNRQDTKDVQELAIVITPHLVRLAHQETAGPILLLSRH